MKARYFALLLALLCCVTGLFAQNQPAQPVPAALSIDAAAEPLAGDSGEPADGGAEEGFGGVRDHTQGARFRAFCSAAAQS